MELKPQTTLEYYLDAILHNLQNDGFVREVPKPPRTRLECFLYHLNEKAKDIGVNYTELEYLESTGTQYIDIGITFNNTDSVFLTASILETESYKFMVSSSKWNDNQNKFGMCGSVVGLFVAAYGDIGAENTKYVPKTQSDFDVHKFIYNNKTFKIEDIGCELNVENIYFGGETKNLYLFYGYNAPTIGKIFSYKHIKNGKLKRDFIPVIYNGDTPCMYDKVERKFYFNKGTGEFIAGMKEKESYTLGLQVDYRTGKFVRLQDAAGLSMGADFDKFNMYGGRKRCVLSDDGEVQAYYGDDNYIEDGSLGQVMVEQPAFYYKVEPIVLEPQTDGLGYHIRKANYYVSDKPQKGFKLHPAFYNENGDAIDYIFLSAYEGSMWDDSEADYVDDGTNTETTMDNASDKLCSVAGVKPISGLKKILNKVNIEAIAKNHGDGWHIETIKSTSENQLLMMIELGTMNTQTAIGQGVVSIVDHDYTYNCASLTGSTSELGNGTGQATMTVNEKGGATTEETASGKVSITYRGVENPWGNIFKHINGVNIWGDSMAGGQPYVAEDFTFNESKHDGNYHPVGFTIPNANGYINAMGYGSEEFDWLLMPSEIGGTSASPVGDYAYVSANLNGYRIAILGGRWSVGGMAGSFCWSCESSVGYRSRAIGGRLLYVPPKNQYSHEDGPLDDSYILWSELEVE